MNTQGTIVVQAAGLTMTVFLGLTLFTFQTKIDFSFLVSFFFFSDVLTNSPLLILPRQSSHTSDEGRWS